MPQSATQAENASRRLDLTASGHRLQSQNWSWMSTAVYQDPTFDDARRRRELYARNIVVHSQRAAVQAIVNFTAWNREV
jgi:hypothetical protein